MKLEIAIGAENPILRKIAEPVKQNQFPSVRVLAESMLAYIKNPKNKGIGLAAPQVGVSKRIIIVGLPKKDDDQSYPIIIMINPTIIEKSRETEVGEEGCLSLPDQKGKVERAKTIVVEWYDIKGKKIKKTIDGYGAKVVQHEVDHLDGILISDKFLK